MKESFVYAPNVSFFKLKSITIWRREVQICPREIGAACLWHSWLDESYYLGQKDTMENIYVSDWGEVMTNLYNNITLT